MTGYSDSRERSHSNAFDSEAVTTEHTVKAVTTSQVVTARPASPSHELVRPLEQHHLSALPMVNDSGRLVASSPRPTC
jgi:CBS-domain-containing membrane protein